MTYIDTLRAAMSFLAEQPNAIFLGQSVLYPGTSMFRTLEHIDPALRVEMPVFENAQMGISTGLALSGYLPVTCYPRINFLLCAVDQLVSHLDKISLYSDGGYNPRVIIRTAIATPTPLNPGEQHLGDYSMAFQLMLKTIHVEVLDHESQIMPAYEAAVERKGSSLIIEHLGAY